MNCGCIKHSHLSPQSISQKEFVEKVPHQTQCKSQNIVAKARSQYYFFSVLLFFLEDLPWNNYSEIITSCFSYWKHFFFHSIAKFIAPFKGIRQHLKTCFIQCIQEVKIKTQINAKLILYWLCLLGMWLKKGLYRSWNSGKILRVWNEKLQASNGSWNC